MQDRWNRFAPLTGVLFAVLAVVGVVSGGESPNGDASAAKVIAYYSTHQSEAETSTILFALAFLVVVLFAGALRSYLRRAPGAEGLSALVLAGGVLMGAGAITGAAIEFALAHQIHHLGPEAAQAVSLLANEIFLPVLAGAFILAVSSGLAILRGAALPKWLGWVAIVLGIAALIPPASFPSLLGFAIWSIVVSILMFIRLGRSEATATP